MKQKHQGKRLFILSGQSNMERLDLDISFTPTLADRLGHENIIVVKDAEGGQPIYRWYKQWKSPDGDKPEVAGDLYDRLMGKVFEAIEGESIRSVVFLWMQGERDAHDQYGKVYESSLRSLFAQVSNDLGRNDLYYVIGRLSDFDLENKTYPHWTMIRDVQVSIANSSDRMAWVDTDDLNDGINAEGDVIENDLHYSVEGYRIFGKRLAEKAIELIQREQ